MGSPKTSAGEAGFKLTGWTELTIFPVPAGGRELPQPPDPSGSHRQEAASRRHSHCAPRHPLRTRQAVGAGLHR